jgi:hypothetical protein
VEIDLVSQLYSAGLQNLWNALAMERCCWRKAVLTTGSRRSARLALFLQGAIFATGACSTRASEVYIRDKLRR